MKRSSDRTLAGSCLCGAVQYVVPDSFSYAFNCHCSQCRRATGSAFKPFAGIERDAMVIAKGTHALMRYGDASDACDVHCSKCGSLLFSIVREGLWVHVTLGTLIDEPSIRVSEHIFVDSKAAWFEITDDLPQHDQLP